MRLIVDEELRPQIAYNRAAAHQMHVLDHRLHVIGMLLFGISILSCLVFITAYLTAYDWVRANAGTFIALSAGLPALGAAIFGIRVQGDFGGSAERSASTAADLATIVEAIQKVEPGLARKTDLVEAAAATMLADLADWRLAYQQRRLELPG
jgi:phage tail protein X